MLGGTIDALFNLQIVHSYVLKWLDVVVFREKNVRNEHGEGMTVLWPVLVMLFFQTATKKD